MTWFYAFLYLLKTHLFIFSILVLDIISLYALLQVKWNFTDVWYMDDSFYWLKWSLPIYIHLYDAHKCIKNEQYRNKREGGERDLIWKNLKNLIYFRCIKLVYENRHALCGPKQCRSSFLTVALASFNVGNLFFIKGTNT